PIKSMLQKEGTPAVIQYLRDSSPCMCCRVGRRIQGENMRIRINERHDVPQQPADREWIPLDNDPSNSNSPGMSWIPGQWRYGRGKEWRGSANGYYHSVLNMVFDGLICFSMRNRCLHSPFLQ
ncbi:6090_t:CDS:2, partial [Gigaspora rosea]